MKHDEFIGEVQNRAKLSSRGDADKATRITLETLGQRLGTDAAENTAAQLPGEIGRYLEYEGEPEQFSADEFLDRIVEKGDLELPEANHQARMVLGVLSEAINDAQLQDIDAVLPDDYDDLFAEEEGVPEEQQEQ